MATTKKPVLITGGAGLIGRILIARLHASYALTSFDLQRAPGIPSRVGNLTDFPAVLHACQGHDTVVHLAADPRVDSPWASNLATNIQGTYHVFEAARQAGVQRVIVASSQHATGGFYLEEPYKAIIEGRYQEVPPGYPLLDETCPIRPDGYYGTAKAFGEALGSYYWDYHQVSSLHLRIGWVLATDDPTTSALACTLWLSHRDVAQIVQRCLEAPAALGYDVFYATSDNQWKISDSIGFRGNALRFSQYSCYFNTLPPSCLMSGNDHLNGGDKWDKLPSRHAKTGPSPSIFRMRQRTFSSLVIPRRLSSSCSRFSSRSAFSSSTRPAAARAGA